MNITRGKIVWAKPLCDVLQWLPLDRYVKLLLEVEHQIEHIDTHAKSISETTVGNRLHVVGIEARLDRPREPQRAAHVVRPWSGADHSEHYFLTEMNLEGMGRRVLEVICS